MADKQRPSDVFRVQAILDCIDSSTKRGSLAVEASAQLAGLLNRIDYLEDANRRLSSSGPGESLTDRAVAALLAEHVKMLGSIRAAAKRFGVSYPYLHDVIHGRRVPGKRLLSALGLSRRVVHTVHYAQLTKEPTP